MPITPLDIKNKNFSTRMRGLAPDEVRGFLDLVAREIEELRKERGLLAEKVDELAARLGTYERTEGLLKETLLTAQKTHNELRETAEEQKRAILQQAEQKAREVLLQAEKEAAARRTELSELETRRLNLIDQIRGLAHSCLAMADRSEKQSSKQDDATEGSPER